MKVGNVVARAQSATWPTATTSVSVVVATHNRSSFLDELFDRLSRQTVDVEVVIVDDGSTDGTWPWLERYVATSSLPVLALSIEHTGGPSLPRNTAVAHARAAIVAITDDDCLPEPDWAQAIAAATGDDAAIAQGRTLPAGGARGPWDRTVAVEEPSGLFETCNLGFSREKFVSAGGFPVVTVLGRLPRGFGEDVLLGALVARTGGFAWAPEAVVRHRWIATSYSGHLRGVRRLSGFPWLAREVPEVAERLVGGVFLSRRTLEYDAALVGVLAAALTRRPLLAAAALPWTRQAVTRARRRTGKPVAVRLAQEAVSDTVGLASLVAGSARYRRVVL
jgi:glycosyltransferase involved in cell wall biosynthesis